MSGKKLKSFTLSEMLVVLVITAIVIGIGFSVLRLVQREVTTIEKNFEKRTQISLFNQRMVQDFDRFQDVISNEQSIILSSENDTINYHFFNDYVLRNSDTIKLKINAVEFYLQGTKTSSGACDAVKLSLEKEIPGYYLFLNTSPDAAYYLNQDGF
jgi:type II secretory pathway component PulJ